MKTALKFYTCLCVLACQGCDSLSNKSTNAINTFHHDYNNNAIAKIILESSPIVHQQNKAESLEKEIKRTKEMLGNKLETLELIQKTTQFTQQPLIYIEQHSKFENGTAIEKFTYEISGNLPTLLDYTSVTRGGEGI
jgi:hypothetical protein